MNSDAIHLDPARYLDPARSVIEKLGGIDVVCTITKRHRSRIFRWMYPIERGGTGGLIPQREHSKLLGYAKETDIRLLPVHFIQTPKSNERRSLKRLASA